MPDASRALSIRQPWATLVVLGLKTIEIRRWPTRHRGHLYIHAAKILDDRPQGWEKLPESEKKLAELRGGVIGSVELHSCFIYRRQQDFNRDAAQHGNDPSWFERPPLYGFGFRNPRILPFHECPGNLRIFTLDWPAEPEA